MQTRRINLVGQNCRPKDGWVGDQGVGKLVVPEHAQIMSGELVRLLFGAIEPA